MPFRELDDNHEVRTVELLKFAARTHLARSSLMLHHSEIDSFVDYEADMLVLRLQGYVYGKEGRPVRLEEDVTVAHLPSWLPRWLQHRWSSTRKVVLDAEPKLLWPDANYAPPEFGRAIQFVHWTRAWRDVEEDVLAGWI